MNKLEMVKQWRRTFGLPVSETPVVPSVEQLKLHAKLISDEADEINEVFSLGGVIDGYKLRDVAVDLLYFALGLMCEAGIDFKESLTRYQAENQKLEGTSSITDAMANIKTCCGALVNGTHEAWEISEFAHEIATNAMLLVFLHDLENYLDSDFTAVHAANMAKLWTKEDLDSKWPIDECKGAPGPGWEFTPVGVNKFVVKLNGKVQKPPGWKAAVLEGGAV